MNNIDDISQVAQTILVVAEFLANTGRALKAIKLCKECLIFQKNDVPGNIELFGKLDMEGIITILLANIYKRQCKYAEAREYYHRAINIMKDTDDKRGEGYAYGQFGIVSYHLGEYDKARGCLEKALAINIEIGDKEGEAKDYGNLGTVFRSLGEYDKAREYHEKALAITKTIGDKEGESSSYENLGAVFHSVGEYDKAREYLEKALAITIEIGDRKGEASSYGNLGIVFKSLGEYDKAREYLEKALAIKIEIGDRKGEASSYGTLGTVFQSLGEYDKARKYLEKALAISVEIGDKEEEASSYGNLGTVFQSVCEYDKAREYHEKALAIRVEIGEKAGEAAGYGNLGTVFQSLGEYDKAREYLEKALAIRVEIGHKHGEASSYGNLGTVFRSLGEYDKAREYYEKALAMKIEIGDKEGEATDYGNLGTVFQSLGVYDKAREYLEKALAITIEIGDRNGEASSYGNLGTVFKSLGEYDKAREYYEKALAMKIEIGDKDGEASFYGNLGSVFQSLGDYVMAESYFETAVSISKDIKDLHSELKHLCNLTFSKLLQEKMEEAFDCLHLCVHKSEDLRGLLEDNDQFKISLLDLHDLPYQVLSKFFCFSGHPNNALYVSELSRARALADLMATQYSVEMQISANPQSWIGIENIMKKESNCACLYISYHVKELFLWIIKTSGVIYFRTLGINENLAPSGLTDSFGEFFTKCFRSFGSLPKEDCEDRSLNDIESELKSCQEESHSAWRLVEDHDEESQNEESSLSLCYKMLIAPVADLLKEPEIIIVPDRSLNQVPFAALSDKCGKFLSETFRIRIVSSLSTLKLIQDSPADYHSQTGALIVGDPEVGRVRYKGCRKTFSPLPFARMEAEMIAELLGVQPLLGQCATKQAVLGKLHSVSLIHFAAHGNAERGEIALSPLRPTRKIPKEEEYLLTMSDISKVRLRAKLVVLSCCHSGRGQVRAEGVVGIARAFLGSGARSVLVALWAIQDSATEQLMGRLYEHLVRGKSASESLHEAMKWMRDNGFTKVCEWAPFMLIGDNVTFDFGKLKQVSLTS